MLSECSVDIWFCYGSFCYGFESTLYSWDEAGVILKLRLQLPEHAEAFIEQVIEKPKGLLRLELRVYGPERGFRIFKINNPIHLVSDVIPSALPSQPEDPNYLFLKVPGLKGISAAHSEAWEVLTRQIWDPEPPSKKPRKRSKLKKEN